MAVVLYKRVKKKKSLRQMAWSECGLDFISLARAWKQAVSAMCVCDCAQSRRWWMRMEFSVASFEVSGEPSILPGSTCTECKLQCVTVSFWQGLALFHHDFREIVYLKFIFLGKEKKKLLSVWLGFLCNSKFLKTFWNQADFEHIFICSYIYIYIYM